MSEALKTPNAENNYDVKQKDLPVSCPVQGSSLWNSHPKVTIAFDENGRGKCPYCGAEFRITD